jgi:polyhydroxyalkanoate synthase
VQDLSAREIIRAAADDGVTVALTRVRREHRSRRAVLLVPGFGQNRFLFDLPARSFARYLAHNGLDAYVLELRGHGRSRTRGGPYARSMADYADLDLPAAIRAVRERGADDILLVGHSMGGVTCMAACPGLLATVRGVVIIASPTHFGRGAVALRWLSAAATTLLRASRAARGGPRALPTELMGGWFREHLSLFDAPLPWPVHIWVPGQIERELLRAYLEAGFDREATGVFEDLARWARHGSFDRAPGRECIRERLRSFPAPIWFVAGKQDLLVPPDSIRPGYEITRAPRKDWALFGETSHRGRYGHVDLLLGRHAPHEVWPRILGWLRE